MSASRSVISIMQLFKGVTCPTTLRAKFQELAQVLTIDH